MYISISYSVRVDVLVHLDLYCKTATPYLKHGAITTQMLSFYDFYREHGLLSPELEFMLSTNNVIMLEKIPNEKLRYTFTH